MKFSRPSIIWMLLVIFLMSCSPQDDTLPDESGYLIDAITNDQSPTVYEIDSAYPIVGQQTELESFFVSEISIPSPQDGQAVVHGILLTASEHLPYLAPSLYLGQIMKLDNGSDSSMTLSSISIEDDPIAIQAIDGKFVFSDIPPGEYGLFLWTPMSVFLIEDAKTGKPVVVEVQSGEVYDLGIIYVQ